MSEADTLGATPGDEEEVERLRQQYRDELHAIQSGIATKIGANISTDTTPKHLRVGVNSALIDSGALATLLARKGLFTRVEYLRVLVETARQQRIEYEAELSQHFGRKVTLG